VQGEVSRRRYVNEGQDHEYLEPIQVPPPLGILALGVETDRHRYLEVIADPEYGDNPQVCNENLFIKIIIR